MTRAQLLSQVGAATSGFFWATITERIFACRSRRPQIRSRILLRQEGGSFVWHTETKEEHEKPNEPVRTSTTHGWYTRRVMLICWLLTERGWNEHDSLLKHGINERIVCFYGDGLWVKYEPYSWTLIILRQTSTQTHFDYSILFSWTCNTQTQISDHPHFLFLKILAVLQKNPTWLSFSGCVFGHVRLLYI